MKKYIRRLGMIILIGSYLIGCGEMSESKVALEESAQIEHQENKEIEVKQEKKNEESTKDNDLWELEEKAKEVIITEDTVEFIDGLGEQKIIDKNPNRVVSLYTSHTGLWYEAGGEIVGRIQTTTSDAQLPEEALLDTIEIVATSSSAKNISVERIIAANPDLVILGTAMSQPTFVTPLEIAGIETMVVDYEDVSDYLKWFKVFSHLNGKEHLYEEVAKKTLEEIQQTLALVEDTQHAPTVINIYATTKSLSANLSTSTVGKMIDVMGGINIADEWNNPDGVTRLAINLEAVLVANPDKILIQQTSGIGEAEKMIEDLYGNNPAWHALDAVKKGEVYYLDINLFHYKPNSQYNEAYRMLGEIFYPEQFVSK